MNRSLWCVVAWVCFCLDVPVFAQPLTTFRSRYYTITTDLDKEIARPLGEHMDLMFAELSRRFTGFNQKAQASQPFYVFAKRASYLEFLARHEVNAEGSGGMFFVRQSASGLATYLENQSMDRVLHTVRHEGFHQFAYLRIGTGLPIWVNEGLAEYYGESIAVGKTFVTGQVPVDVLRIVQAAAAANSHIPFDQMLTMSSEKWSRRVRDGEAGIQYAQAWSMVHFLVHGDARYQRAFVNYLHAVAGGAEGSVAFARAFGASVKPFETAWQKYVAALEPTPECTAAQRLGFLSQGIVWLRSNGKKADTLEQIKSQLQASQFWIKTSVGEGAEVQLKAENNELFQPPPAPNKGGKTALEMVASKDDRLPAGFVITGLKYPVRLVWEIGPSGQPVSQIVYQ